MVQASSDGLVAPADGSLDLHEGLSHPGGAKCRRTGHLWLFSQRTGELIKPRCKSPNKCEYDAMMVAIENTEMLSLDACEGDPPQLVAILSTRTATVDMGRFYRARELVLRALRRRYAGAQYACLLEYTTGYGPASGGERRPHWNLLLKGIPAEDVDQVRELVSVVWCRHVDAERGVQYVEVIENAGALMRYVAQHFQKDSQAPPADFKGQRFNCSRHYFTGCTRAQARERARRSLARKRAIWHATEAGLSAHDAELVVGLAEKRLTRWQLVVWKPGERPQTEVSEARRYAHHRRTRAGRETDSRPPPASRPDAGRGDVGAPDATAGSRRRSPAGIPSALPSVVGARSP
jgi:hypothetical protein